MSFRRLLPRLRRRSLAAVTAAALVPAVLLPVREITAAAGASVPLSSGVVDVETNLGYQNAATAGTGMVIDASGVVLTNNHVIRGATTIRVVDPATKRSYAATVLGYEIGADIAVLKLKGAAGLKTVRLGDSSKVRRGAAVTAVGNAGGAGTLTATAGSVTALGQTITASDGQGSAQQLRGLIGTNAGLEPGDSGGPLLDRAGRVIGMDTAASSGFVLRAGGSRGYAIPINRALTTTRQVEAGRASAAVHIGATAFLGVSVQASSYRQGEALVPAALVVGVASGSPAERAGLAPGDLVTWFDGRAVASSAALASLVLHRSPGAPVQVRWVDGTGTPHSASVTLASGPPQ